MVEFIKSKFKIRQCRNFKYKDRACLNYNIKRCPAPCMGYISKEEYRKTINDIVDILEGKTEKLEKDLKKEMTEQSLKQNFEKAAEIRDELYAIERISAKQKVSNLSDNNIDVIGIEKSEKQVCITIFYIRNSKMIGRDNFFLNGLNDEKNEEIISEFIQRYYADRKIIPNKIMIRNNFEDRELYEEWLTSIADKKVEIKIPKKGEKIKLVEMAENNAKIALEIKERGHKDLVLEMKELLKLDKLPRKIEAFDISNISGEYMVAGMCVMIDGVIKKNLSRRFKVKTVYEQDDPKCMEEVITRRLLHSINDSNNKGFGDLPDLILADGGITQINATINAIKNVEKETKKKTNINVFGMVKNSKHQTRALMDENRNEIEISEDIFNLITNFQNEVHNIAIGYHKFLRDKSMSKSELDNIKGVGTVKKLALLKEFGSVQKIKEASINDITRVKGINLELAKHIKDSLK